MTKSSSGGVCSRLSCGVSDPNMTQSVTGGRSRSSRTERNGSGSKSRSAIVEHGEGYSRKYLATLGSTAGADAFTDAFSADTHTRTVVSSDRGRKTPPRNPPQSDWTPGETSPERGGVQIEAGGGWGVGEAVDSLTSSDQSRFLEDVCDHSRSGLFVC